MTQPPIRRSVPLADTRWHESEGAQMRELVIDDDPGVRVLCRISFPTGGDSIEVASGRAGLELLATETVDAVVLDVMLPSVNGSRSSGDPQGPTHGRPAVVLLSVRVGIRDQIDGGRQARRLPHEIVLNLRMAAKVTRSPVWTHANRGAALGSPEDRISLPGA